MNIYISGLISALIPSFRYFVSGSIVEIDLAAFSGICFCEFCFQVKIDYFRFPGIKVFPVQHEISVENSMIRFRFLSSKFFKSAFRSVSIAGIPIFTVTTNSVVYFFC